MSASQPFVDLLGLGLLFGVLLWFDNGSLNMFLATQWLLHYHIKRLIALRGAMLHHITLLTRLFWSDLL